jgi:DNA-binding NarL/FixJ family response regulator
MKAIRILLADDHKLFIDGLGSLLERRPGLEIVGAARDGLSAVELASDLNPNIILMDVSMPRLNGIEAARKILSENPSIKIIMLSMHADRRYVVEALRAGARGYLLKDSAAEELLSVLERVSAGEICLTNKISQQIIQDYLRVSDAETSTAFTVLSPREREVLQLLAEGHSTKEIAARLSISVKTVETHRSQIMNKVNLHSVAELTKYAIREGLTQVG